jgi:hypothetical protein
MFADSFWRKLAWIAFIFFASPSYARLLEIGGSFN